ncbi:hypothetical protein GGD81_004012 [Rhodobium orientis]|uniref:hypothetical protein n=1 Tax=Rhodobium orientis TaxID=34017 RepID=UPI001839C152|nr:hypothetical protein [Rhodobium orientis]MBB4304947.1 hypothetical protein [Rhodobium orientis]
MSSRLLIAFFGAALFGVVHANAAEQGPAPDAKALITPAMVADARAWVDTEIVRVSVEAQNGRYGALQQAEIDALDKQWREEREAADKPLIAATLSNPLSVYLSRMQGRSVGLYVEIFVMDDNGLNVGQSSITGDFWQGDEAKFQKTFPVGPDAVFIDEPEWDDDFKIWRAQLNYTLTAEDGTTPIGAATVEVNLTEAARRQAAGS